MKKDGVGAAANASPEATDFNKVRLQVLVSPKFADAVREIGFRTRKDLGSVIEQHSTIGKGEK